MEVNNMITLLSVVALAELLQLIVPLCTASKVILFEARKSVELVSI